MSKSKKVIFNGKEYDSIKTLAQSTNTNYLTLLNRLQRGIPVEDAVNNTFKTGRSIQYNGKQYSSIKELSKDININYATILSRMNDGKSIDEIIAMGNDNPELIKVTYKGKSYNSLTEISNDLNLNYATLLSRIQRGYSIEDAIEKEIQKSAIKIEYNGQIYDSISALAKKFGIKQQTLNSRIFKQKRTVEEAIAMGPANASRRGKRIFYNNKEYNSIKELTDDLGLQYNLIKTRLARGKSIEEAITMGEGKDYQKIEYNGKIYESRVALAKEFNIPVGTLEARLRQGKTIETAIKLGHGKKGIYGKRITYNGKEYDSISQLAKAVDINYYTLRSRLYLGKTVEEAIAMGTDSTIKTTIEYNNTQYESINDLKRKLNINMPYTALYYRLITKKMSIDDILKEDNKW